VHKTVSVCNKTQLVGVLLQCISKIRFYDQEVKKVMVFGKQALMCF